MTEYGLPGRRDSKGNRKPVEHTYEWNGTEVTIKLEPPSLSEAEDYEELGEDIESSKMAEIVNRHLVKPDIPEDDMGIDELMCYAEGIFDYVAQGDDFEQRVDEELEKRSDGEGNATA